MTAFAQPVPPPAHHTPAPIRRVLLAAAALLALALLAMATFSLLDIASRHTTTERASYDRVRALVVEDASDVRLTSAPAGAPVQVVAHVTEGLSSPKRSAERSGDGTLELSSSCPGFFGGNCHVSYDIRVPRGTLVKTQSSAGDVVADGLVSRKPVELASSAGDVTATDVTAPSVRLESSAGDVQARDLSAQRVRAHSSAGDVSLSLRSPARDLMAESSAGDVEVLVPDAVYRVDASSSAGDVDDRGLRTDPSSKRTITAHSSAGDVRVAARR
jgi:hypothetical protein